MERRYPCPAARPKRHEVRFTSQKVRELLAFHALRLL